MTQAAPFTPPFLIGIDLGTNSVRALAFDTLGRAVATAAQPTPAVQPAHGWVEYQPDALWQAALDVLRRLVAALPPGAPVVGLAVASIGESFVPVDAQGRATNNAIAWFDPRTEGDADLLEHRIGRERLFQITGLPVNPIYSLCKMLWLKRQAPDAWSRTVRVLGMADWIAFRLCGEMATDFSLASRTLAFDLHDRCWAETLLDEVDISPDLFPPLRPSGTALATLRPDVAAKTGLPPGTMVGVGGHDHLCGGLAAGTHLPGTLLDSMGTAEALFLTLKQPLLAPAVLQQGFPQGAIQVDGAYAYLGGGIYSSGGAVEWFRSVLAGGADYDTLIAEAAAAPPGANGALFMPHLAQSAPPHPDVQARGALVGLTGSTGRGDLFRAVLEGLALEARQVVGAMAALPGLGPPQDIRAIGGNTKNALLLRIKASAYGRPITVVDEPETTALGAALLGGIAAGTFESLAAARATLVQRTRTVDPDRAWSDHYDTLFERLYRHGFAALRPLNHAIHQLDTNHQERRQIADQPARSPAVRANQGKEAARQA